MKPQKLPSAKKATGTIQITLGKAIAPKVIVPRAFNVMAEKMATDGVLDILFDPADKGAAPIRVLFDPGFFAGAALDQTKYLAAVGVPPDDTSMSNNVIFAQEAYFANMLHLGRVANRSESTFSLVSLHQWGRSSMELKPGETATIEALPVLTIYSNLGLQVKLISELLRITSEHLSKNVD